MLDLINLVRGNHPDHPMSDADEARRLLQDLPENPAKALDELASWLETVMSAKGYLPEIRIEVLKLLDETAQAREPPVLASFLFEPGLKDYDRQQLWQTLLTLWRRIAAANHFCLDEIARIKADAAGTERPRLVVRALRALANEAKMLNLRFLAVPAETWQAACELYALSERGQFHAESVKPYPTEPYASTPRQEFLRQILLDASVPESQPARELELASRIIARLAPQCTLTAQREADAHYCIDLERPGRPVHCKSSVRPGPGMRYVGASRAQTTLREIMSLQAADPEELDKRFGHDYSVPDKMAVLMRLSHCWGESPPKRRTQRVKISASMQVAHGFSAASQLVTRIEFGGMAEITSSLNLKMREQSGLMLQKQDTAPAMVEWTERDASAWGMGVDIPRRDEPWAVIGTLCAFLPAGLKVHWLGVIRRLYRDPQNNLHAGIEVLAKKPLSVFLRGIGQGAQRADNWASSSGSFAFTYVNALMLGESATATRAEMLIPRDTYTPGILYEAMIGDEAPHVQLAELVERGADFDRVRVSWLKTRAKGAPAIRGS